MPTAQANGLTLAYRIDGDSTAPPLVLIMGLGSQLTTWPDEFIDALLERGLRVIRFDNRDIGQSSRLNTGPRVSMARETVKYLLGIPIRPPYTLEDMANDTVGLMDSLGLESAHIIGMSMGGMIGQLVTACHQHRVRSFTSIMSTTGRRGLRQARFGLRLNMVKPRPPSVERETSIQNSIRMWRRLGSPGYPAPETWLRQRIERDYDRCYYPLGISRHLLAVMAARDRTTLLKSIRVPTLIIHGRDDPLVPVDGGEDTAKWIPGAKLKVFDGMGHDLPMQLIPEIADLIAEHVRIAESSHEPSPATVN